VGEGDRPLAGIGDDELLVERAVNFRTVSGQVAGLGIAPQTAGPRPLNRLSSCSCQKMVVASRAIAAFSMMAADDRNVARTALARPVAGHRASPRAITACSREFPVTRN
jgi:hypothetical protein